MIVDPSAVRSSRSLPVARIRPGSEVDFQLVTPSPVWIDTHWLNKQLLCPGDVCPVCGGGGGRTHGFLVVSVRNPVPARLALLELSVASWHRFQSLSKMSDFALMTGTLFTGSRRRKNSPLVCEPTGFSKTVDPADAELARVLDAVATLFGLPVMKPKETALEWSDRVRHLASSMLGDCIAVGA